MLNEFRLAADFVWDRASKRVLEKVTLNQGDANGRKMRVQVVNNGVVENLTGAGLNLAWVGRLGKGLDNFTVVDATKGIFELAFKTGMLNNTGSIKASLQLVLPSGSGIVESTPFQTDNRPSLVDSESAQSTDSWTALENALANAANLEAQYTPKLFSLEAQLQQTIPKNRGAVSSSDLSQEVKEQLTGGSVAVVGVNTINNINILPDAVSEYELSIVKKNQNLFNSNNLISGFLLDTNDGVSIDASTSWSTTKDYIRINPDSYLYKNKLGGYVIYDESFNIAQRKGNGTGAEVVSVPENGYFIKVNVQNSDIGSYQLEYGEVETEYEEGRIWFDKKIGLSGSSLERESIEINKMTGFESSQNILNPRRIINDVYVNRTNGELVSNQNNFTYKGVAIPLGADKLRVGEFDVGNVNYATRNMNGDYIVGGQILLSDSNRVINVPKGVASIDISFDKNEVGKAMLSVGEEHVDYDDYYKYFTDIVNRNSGNDYVRQGTHLSGKKIVCFGDSITGSYSSPTDYPSFLAERLGATTYNVGFSGGRMSNRGNEYDFFSMVGIVDAIIANDFTSQDSNDELNSNWKEKIGTLKGIDFSDIDIVTIFYGTNDYNSNVGALDNELDPFDTTTVLGAARYAIRELQQEFPHLMIVLCSTTWRTDGEGFADDGEVGRIGVTMSELVEGLKSVSDYHHVPFIDMYNGLGINRYNFEEYLLDGLHPNPKGRKLIGDRIASQLLANI